MLFQIEIICLKFFKSISDESDRPFIRKDDSPSSSAPTISVFDERINVEGNEIGPFSIGCSLLDVYEE